MGVEGLEKNVDFEEGEEHLSSFGADKVPNLGWSGDSDSALIKVKGCTCQSSKLTMYCPPSSSFCFSTSVPAYHSSSHSPSTRCPALHCRQFSSFCDWADKESGSDEVGAGDSFGVKVDVVS